VSQIIQVEVGQFDYDFQGEFKFFPADPDGKVRRPSVLVRLSDDDGYQGWGQAVPVPTWTYETKQSVESTITQYLSPAILGADPEDIQQVHKRMEKVIRPGFTVGQPLCKAAIDMACHDLASKRAGSSLAQYLGGARREALVLSWTVNSMDMAVVEAQLEEGRERGYRNYNIKVGPPQSAEYDLELAHKVRSFAPDGFLWADANTGYSVDAALDLLPKLADAGVEVMESPIPPNHIRGYQALKRQGALPIYMDEGVISPVETEEFIELGMLDGITLKPARCGGLWHTKNIIELAHERGIPLLGSGLTDPDLSLAAALHLYAWAGLERPCALNGPQFLVDSLCTKSLAPHGDILTVPTQAGLGLDMDPCTEGMLTVIAKF
jgi:L-alanine-DL-glutamate epimerase-like enolase superfamily enzyme